MTQPVQALSPNTYRAIAVITGAITLVALAVLQNLHPIAAALPPVGWAAVATLFGVITIACLVKGFSSQEKGKSTNNAPPASPPPVPSPTGQTLDPIEVPSTIEENKLSLFDEIETMKERLNAIQEKYPNYIKSYLEIVHDPFHSLDSFYGKQSSSFSSDELEQLFKNAGSVSEVREYHTLSGEMRQLITQEMHKLQEQRPQEINVYLDAFNDTSDQGPGKLKQALKSRETQLYHQLNLEFDAITQPPS